MGSKPPSIHGFCLVCDTTPASHRSSIPGSVVLPGLLSVWPLPQDVLDLLCTSGPWGVYYRTWAYSEEALRRSSFRSSTLSLWPGQDALFDLAFALQNRCTKRYSQAGTPSCKDNVRLNVSIPPLDAFIIPKA